MADMSDFLESGLAQHMFRTSSYTKPATLAICLATGTLTESMDGTLGSVEVVNASGYARQLLAPSNSNWTYNGQVGGSGNVDNASEISFGPATGPWGTVTYLAITDSGTYGSGNMLYFKALDISKSPTSGDYVKIAVGSLDVYFG